MRFDGTVGTARGYNPTGLRLLFATDKHFLAVKDNLKIFLTAQMRLAYEIVFAHVDAVFFFFNRYARMRNHFAIALEDSQLGNFVGVIFQQFGYRRDVIITLNHADNFSVGIFNGHFDNDDSQPSRFTHDDFGNVFIAFHSFLEVIASLKVYKFGIVTAHELLSVIARQDYIASVLEECVGILDELFHIWIAIFWSRRQIFLHSGIDRH